MMQPEVQRVIKRLAIAVFAVYWLGAMLLVFISPTEKNPSTNQVIPISLHGTRYVTPTEALLFNGGGIVGILLFAGAFYLLWRAAKSDYGSEPDKKNDSR